MRHIQLHPLGGVAGDMFVACLMDAFPEHAAAAVAAAERLSGVRCRAVPHQDGVMAGQRFVVEDGGGGAHHPHTHGDGHHGSEHEAGHEAGHVHWREIERRLAGAGLPAAVREAAVGIFSALADAEARVHGVAAADVTFHEVGAADSVADIVAAASLVAAVSPATWSVTALPLGGGTVQTAHGVMSVPTPATALLLDGFAMVDDGVGGERVTPTGAAILRYLGCHRTGFAGGVLGRSGTGFGTRRLPGRSNCLRALAFEQDAADGTSHRELGVISFEVDDQSGEELAHGVERLRELPGVHDVVQIPCFGKKSRLAVHIQVLTRPDMIANVVDACFRETTTIGLRTQTVQGQALVRRMAEVEVAGRAVPVKLVDRPGEMAGGRRLTTAKAEADDFRGVLGHAERTRLRREAEQAALAHSGERDTERNRKDSP